MIDKEFERYTPVQIINLYIDSLKEGDNVKLNKILSDGYLESFDTNEGFPEFSPIEISDVEIKPLDLTSLNPIIAEKYSDISDSECYYILDFELVRNDNLSLFSGPGMYSYYVKLVLEDNIWKIDALATSP